MTAQIYTSTDPDLIPGTTWITDAQLREVQFPDAEYLIVGMLPCGYTCVIGAPKTGKTALALPIAQKLTRAGYRVLYLVMDDSLSRMKTRSIMASPATEPGYNPMHDLWYLHGWDPQGKDRAFAQLRSWLQRAKDGGTPFDVVIVDTYGRFAGRKPPGVDVFSYDYAIGSEFKRLFTDFGVSTMVNHHARKRGGDDVDWLDMVSGSAGMTAAADAIWYIERTRGSRNGMLRITGNDMPELELPMSLGANMVWTRDNTITPAQARHSGMMRAVLDYMMAESQTAAKSLAEELGAPQNTIHQCLQRLAAEGVVSFGNKVWELTGHDDNRVIQDPEPEIPTKRVSEHSGPVAQPIGSPQPGGSAGGAGDGRGPSGVGLTPETPVGLPPMPEPSTVPGPRTAPDDDSVPWCEDAVAPLPSGEGAVGMMIETLKQRKLMTAFRLKPEMKALIPDYDQMMLGGTTNTWQFFPRRRPEGTLVAFDRKASFYSSKCWLSLQSLVRTGPMDLEQIRKEKRAGIFEIVPAPWLHKDLPSPYGMQRPPGRLKVTRGVINRLFSLANKDMMDPPQILSTLSGRGSENVLQPWFDWCLTQRRECAHDPDLAAMRKSDQNHAIGSLRVTTPGKPLGPIDRPDWQFEIISTHYMMMHYYALQCIEMGDPLIARGMTDELVFLLPEGEDPTTWVPAGLQDLVKASKFARKAVRLDENGVKRLFDRDASQWYEVGGQGAAPFEAGGR